MNDNFLLTTCLGHGVNNIYDPSPEVIEQAINELIPVEDYFVILNACENPAEHCEYLQTTLNNGEDADSPVMRYQVEARFEYGNKLGQEYKHYQTFIPDVNVVKKMFRMFALGVVPRMDGWKDITDKV